MKTNLVGTIPDGVEEKQIQIERAINYINSKTNDLDKYISLNQIKNTNLTLFYSLILKYLKVYFYYYSCLGINSYYLYSNSRKSLFRIL